MIPRDVRFPTVAIPFHRFLKVVAIVDAENPQREDLQIKFHTYVVRE
jgi:ornithine decarboxylase